MCQSIPDRRAAMLRLSLIVILLTQRIPAYVTDLPSFADRLDKLYEKLERLTVSPRDQQLDISPDEKLYAKLDRLNSLGPEREITDEDEDMLKAMQTWGMLNADQLDGVVKELQVMKAERSDGEYDWDEDQDPEGDYPADGNEEWDDVDPDASTTKPNVVTPSAFTRQDPETFREVVSAVDPIAATNERPRVLEDASLTPLERSALRRAALAHISSVVKASKCLTPQPRWLSVRQLAPTADTVYMPPCVQLHRCAPDSGCCHNEAEICAPVDGKYVTMPFYLNKADGNFTVARMLFFNHTRCACVSRETLQSTIRTRVEMRHTAPVRRIEREGQNDWRSTEEPKLEKDEEPTAPPQMRRCTCPTLFMAKMSENSSTCSCVCEWPDLIRRRDCLSLARGREHFGLKDRVCITNGDCNPPTCEYGAYERNFGRCSIRKYRRIRYHRSRFEKLRREDDV